jgi:tryptophan-rich sensory protein
MFEKGFYFHINQKQHIMKQQAIIAALIGAVVSFLLGWLAWGVLTMDFYNANTNPVFAGLQKDPPVVWVIFFAQLCWGLMIAYVMDKSGGSGMVNGLRTGAVLFFLMETAMVSMFYATMDIYSNSTIMIFDIALNTIFGGIVGAVVGWWLGRGKTA